MGKYYRSAANLSKLGLNKNASRRLTEIVRLLVRRQRALAVFLEGSISRARPYRSDIDVSVIMADGKVAEKVLKRGAYDFHVKFYPLSLLEMQVSQCYDYHFHDILQVQRIKEAIPIFEREGTLTHIQSKLRKFPSPVTFQHLFISVCKLIHDAQEMLDRGYYKQSVLNSRSAAEAAALLCCFMQKNSMPKSKWTLIELMEAAPGNISDLFESIQGLRNVVRREAEELIMLNLSLAFKLRDLLTMETSSVHHLRKVETGPHVQRRPKSESS